MKKLFVSILVVLALVLSLIGVAFAIDIPAVPTPIAPANGAVLETTSPSQVTLVWLPITGAISYNVIFATTADFVTPIFSAMTTANQQMTPYLSYGVTYYWKVQAVNSAGTSAWSANQTFTLVPRAPILLSPANGAVFFLGSPVNLSWQYMPPYPSWFGFMVEVAYEPTFAEPYIVTRGATTTSNFVFNPPGVSNYYWRVKVMQINPMVSSSWSEVRIFRITFPPLIAPNIVSPRYNELITNNEVTLSWSTVPYASYYQIQTRGANFDQVVYNNSYPMFLASGQGYSWRVRAGNAYEWGPWSDWVPFKCLLTPGVVNLTAPYNGTQFKALGATLTWQSVAMATSYNVSLTDDLTGQTWVFNSTASSYFVETQFNHQYSWKISATNEAGQGQWSTVWHFSVPDITPPVLSVNTLPEWTNQKSLTISGKATDAESGIDRILINGVPILFNPQGEFNYIFSVSEGINFANVTVYDKIGNVTSKQTSTKGDTISPKITITRPLTIESKVVDDIAVEGKVIDAGGIKTLFINNNLVAVDRNGHFSYPTTLNYGPNQIYILVTDFAGNQSKMVLDITKVPRTITLSLQVGIPQICIIQIGRDGEEHFQYKEIDPGRNTTPLLRNDRMFIPIRMLIEELNGEVFWDAQSQKITINMPKTISSWPIPGKIVHIELWIGNPKARITDVSGYRHWVYIEPGNEKVVPFIANGRGYFPLRFVVESLDIPSKDIEWMEELQQVKIIYSLAP